MSDRKIPRRTLFTGAGATLAALAAGASFGPAEANAQTPEGLTDIQTLAEQVQVIADENLALQKEIVNLRTVVAQQGAVIDFMYQKMLDAGLIQHEATVPAETDSSVLKHEIPKTYDSIDKETGEEIHEPHITLYGYDKTSKSVLVRVDDGITYSYPALLIAGETDIDLADLVATREKYRLITYVSPNQVSSDFGEFKWGDNRTFGFEPDEKNAFMPQTGFAVIVPKDLTGDDQTIARNAWIATFGESENNPFK